MTPDQYYKVYRVNGRIYQLLFALALAFPAKAQTIETVVVSAAPPDPVGTKAFSSVRLGSEDLALSPRLDEALAQVPGLSLYRRNASLSANPTTQGVSLRSIAPSAAGRALVTLDGVPQNDPFGGWVIWSSLPPEDIAEATVVRGAGAGPYGAGALTGVIALKENPGEWRASVSGGEAGQRRIAASGGTDLGGLALYASASRAASDGWIPVSTTQRGAADDELTFDGGSAALRLQAEPVAGTLISARLTGYRESRHSGIVGTGSDTSGMIASLTAAHPARNDLGWRLQAWLHTSDFAQTSASISSDRAVATPSNQQTATPATGWGANAALRGEGLVDWELGADIRAARGNAHELASYQSGWFTLGRVSGGDSVVSGLYAEGAYHGGAWLATAGLRADAWSSANGHTTQTTLATGVATTQSWPSRSGVLPTARAGLRYGDDALYLRTAAYKGFRAPSLNELYRPFRLGNNVTMANAALKPETLSGVEIGAGGTFDAFAWDISAFYNRLHAAVTNVTVGVGPGNFPGAGFVPAGGLLIQRQNVGNINAPGVEGNVTYTDGPWRLSAAFTLLDQRVHGGSAAQQLDRKRPAQAPRATLTAAAAVKLTPALTASANVRYESNRFSDDANTLRLGSSAVTGARVEYALGNGLAAYVAADNLFDARVATTSTADGILSHDAPRIVTVGLTFAR